MNLRFDFDEQLNLEKFKTICNKLLLLESFKIDVYISEYNLVITNTETFTLKDEDLSQKDKLACNVSIRENNNTYKTYKHIINISEDQFLNCNEIISKYFTDNGVAIFRFDKENQNIIIDLIIDICSNLFNISKNKIFL